MKHFDLWDSLAEAILWPLMLGLLLGGCIPSAALVPVTPANADQVRVCKVIAGEHNGFVVGDVIISGLGTTAAGIGAGLSTSNTGLKDGVTTGAAVAGGLAMAGAALVAYTSSAFASSKCSSVVGDLPTQSSP